MRTIIGGENVYCVGSGTWLPDTLDSNQAYRRAQRIECPECHDNILTTARGQLRVHFAPYRVGPDGRRAPGAAV